MITLELLQLLPLPPVRVTTRVTRSTVVGYSGHGSHDERGAGSAPAVRSVDRAGDVVDTYSLPTPPGRIDGVLTTPTAKIEDAARRPGSLSLFPVQDHCDARSCGLSVTLPGSELETAHQGVTGARPHHRGDLPADVVRAPG